MKTPLLTPLKKLSLALLAVELLAIAPVSASPTVWLGTNAVSPNLNWSTTANWSITPVSDAANFTASTAVTSLGITTVNVDGAYGTPGSGLAQSYGAFFGMTNGYHTVLIQPGITWAIQANATPPTQGIGIEVGPQPLNNNNINTANTVSGGITYTNYTTITGIGGTFLCDGGASTGGLRVEAASTVANNHYSILDMSGLGTFYLTNVTGLSSSCGFYLVNGGANSQGLIYLALTNVITLNNNFQVGYLGSSSNSLPIGVYLGQSNYITTGANNNNLDIGYTGCTNAFMKFNSNVFGGSTMPSAYIAGSGGSQNALICSPATGNVPGYAICDFTGGTVTWQGNSLKLGVSGTASPNTAANGVLNFNNGTVSFNTILVGDQSVSAGAPGVGTINIGTNATLLATNSITLGAVTGTANAGTVGTINVNSNGTLQTSTITNGGAGSAINMTNANLALALTSTAVTNITVANFNAAGPTNFVNITSIPLFLSGTLPLRFHLIATANLVGGATLGVGSLPISANPFYSYQGYLDSTSTPGLIDFVLTSAPPSVRSLTWTGLSGGNPDGNWDVGVTSDWETNSIATFFNQLDLATFYDVSPSAQTSVSLTTNGLTPSSIIVSNTVSVYTIGLSSDPGNITGSTGLTKQGPGTLILDNGVSNTFTGGVTISGGILQVGKNDTGGNLPAGQVTDNAVLAYDRVDNVSVGNVIAGSGAVVSAGGGTLKLTAGNTFTGTALATNNSILQGGVAGAFGASNGAIVIANGSTLDVNGAGTLRAITVSGAGVNGNGAIVNSGGAIYDSASSPVQMTPAITLTGDTTFSYQTRWDLGFPTGASFPLSTGGQPYNLTLNGTANNSYFEWREVKADANLANITVTAGYFGITGATTLGNTTSSSLNILSGGASKFYANDGFNVTINKPLVLNDEGTIDNETGTNTIAGGLVITNSGGNQYCVLNVLATSLTVSGPMSGDGILWMESSTGPLIITGNASAFTGGVLVYAGGTFILDNIIGSGITNEAGATLGGYGAAEGYVDVSGAFIPGGSNAVGTFTANAGLTLESGATVTMNLEASTNTGGTHNSLLSVTGNLSVNGNTLLVNPIGTLVNGTYTLMTYTGSLIGTFGNVQTVAPSGYTLTLNTSTTGLVQLIVGDAPVPATFTGPYTVSGSSLTLTGTGGTPSGTYHVYSTTNAAALTNEAAIIMAGPPVGSGSFDASGNFSFPTTVTNGMPHFYFLAEP